LSSPRRRPTWRARVVIALEAIAHALTQHGIRSELLEDLDPKVARRRELERARQQKCRAKLKQERAANERDSQRDGHARASRHAGSFRGTTPVAAASVTQRDGHASRVSPPRSPSLPERTEPRAKRPSAAKLPRGPIKELGSFWHQECLAARVDSILSIDDWNAFKELHFEICGRDLDRTKDLIRPYVRDCGNTKQTPSAAELVANLRTVRGGSSGRNGANGSRHAYCLPQVKARAELERQARARGRLQ
jgi:hypothetical protein